MNKATSEKENRMLSRLATTHTLHRASRRMQQGLTLVEIMVVVVIMFFLLRNHIGKSTWW